MDALVGLETLPSGMSYYTAHLAVLEEDGWQFGDEIDFVARRGLSDFAAQTAAYDSSEFKSDYTSVAQGGNHAVAAVTDFERGLVFGSFDEV